MSLSQDLRSALDEYGVSAVFHLPGSSMLTLYDSIEDLDLVLLMHPAAVGYAADAFARLRGIGVALVAQGPGIAGIIPAIIHSWKDSIPLITITSRPGYMKGDPNAWQAFPIYEMLGPIVKGIVEIDPGSPHDSFKKAFKLATTPPSGPVVINVSESCENSKNKGIPAGLMDPLPLPVVSDEFYKQILDALKASKRPLIVAGGGSINYAKSLTKLIEKLYVPTVTTTIGRGIVPEDNPLCLGPIGTIGNPTANEALCQTDLIIAFGSRLSRNAIHSLLAEEIRPDVFQVAGKTSHRSMIVDQKRFSVCDLGSILSRLETEDLQPFCTWIEKVNSNRKGDDHLNPTLANSSKSNIATSSSKTEDITAFKEISADTPADISTDFSKPSCSDEDHSSTSKSTPSSLLASILESVSDKDTVIMDAGSAGIAIYKNIVALKPYHLLYQWGISSMGTSLSAAIGSYFAGARRVVVVAGDSGFLSCGADLSTIALKRLPIKMVVFNNAGMNLIRELQKAEIGREVDTSFGPVDLSVVADGFGIKTFDLGEGSCLQPEMVASLQDDQPLLLEISQERFTVDLKGTQWESYQHIHKPPCPQG